MPAASRPTAAYPRERRSWYAASPSTGTQTATDAPGNRSPRGTTPTTVYSSPSARSGRPTTPGSPPKRVRHRSWLIAASRLPDEGARPIANDTPKVRKNPSDTYGRRQQAFALVEGDGQEGRAPADRKLREDPRAHDPVLELGPRQAERRRARRPAFAAGLKEHDRPGPVGQGRAQESPREQREGGAAGGGQQPQDEYRGDRVARCAGERADGLTPHDR